MVENVTVEHDERVDDCVKDEASVDVKLGETESEIVPEDEAVTVALRLNVRVDPEVAEANADTVGVFDVDDVEDNELANGEFVEI